MPWVGVHTSAWQAMYFSGLSIPGSKSGGHYIQIMRTTTFASKVKAFHVWRWLQNGNRGPGTIMQKPGVMPNCFVDTSCGSKSSSMGAIMHGVMRQDLKQVIQCQRRHAR